jgi:hypothetical protein
VNEPARINGEIVTQDMFDHFAKLAKEDHDRLRAKIERLQERSEGGGAADGVADVAQVSASTRNLPRRVYRDLWAPEEHAIQKAIDEIEAAGSHPLLTDAVVLLGQAKVKVSDWVDQLPEAEE